LKGKLTERLIFIFNAEQSSQSTSLAGPVGKTIFSLNFCEDIFKKGRKNIFCVNEIKETVRSFSNSKYEKR